MWLVAFAVLSFIIPIAIVIGIIVLIVRLTGHKNGKDKKPLGLREALLTTLLLAAGFAGIAGFVLLPYALFGDDEDSQSAVLVTILITAIILLMAGLALKKLTGKFLMSMGLILLTIAMFSAFSILGSVAGLLAVFIAFVALIIITVRVSSKAHKNG